MKRAFTMIELIFVIIILGILASVAVSNLLATRQDAEMSKTAANINRLISDFRAYYLSQGELANLNKMTNIQFFNKGFSDADSIPIAGEKCIKVTLVGIQNDGKPSFVKFEAESNVNSLCKKILDYNAIKVVFKNQFLYIKKSTNTTEISGFGEFEISGLNSQI